MKTLKRFALVLLALGMCSCHAYVTGPVLWDHGSSSGFDVYIGLWLINIVVVFWAVFVPLDDH